MSNIVKYKSRDGQDMILTFDIVRNYLVSGEKQYVTDQEIIYFMGICKSRGLNPFKRDCYLIKFAQNDPAAIVVSRDYYRSRAKAQKDCKGWKNGIIIKDKSGNVKDSYGLLMDDENLLGGFFEAKPDGWNEPFRLEVNLNGYIKKKKDGSPTKFWQPENQPTQIAKVAESQGLRALWPDEFQGLYMDSEISMDQNNLDYKQIEKAELQELSFDEQLPENIDMDILNEFLQKCAHESGEDVEQVKKEAAQNMDFFLNALRKFAEQRKTASMKRNKINATKEKGKNDRTQDEKNGPDLPWENADVIPPSNGDIFDKLRNDKKMFRATFTKEAKRLNLPMSVEDMTEEQAKELHKAVNIAVDTSNY